MVEVEDNFRSIVLDILVFRYLLGMLLQDSEQKSKFEINI